MIALFRLWCGTANPTLAPQFWHYIRCGQSALPELFTISYWHLISDICTTILTLDPQLKKASKNRHFLGGKTQKKLAKFFLRLRDAYKKYILQKNWFKTVTGALSSGQHNLHPPIWGRHPQLDDQYRNPNINNRDHLVGQLTSNYTFLWPPAPIWVPGNRVSCAGLEIQKQK